MIESEVLHLALQGFQCGAKETKEERHCVNRLQFPRNGVGAGRKSRAVEPLQEWEVSDESDSEALNCSQPIHCTQRQVQHARRAGCLGVVLRMCAQMCGHGVVAMRARRCMREGGDRVLLSAREAVRGHLKRFLSPLPHGLPFKHNSSSEKKCNVEEISWPCALLWCLICWHWRWLPPPLPPQCASPPV